MSYDTYEISNESAQPVFLYDFWLGNTHWRYTSADEDYIEDPFGEVPVVWTAISISDEGTKQGGSDQNDMQITIAANAEVAQLFRNTKPSGKVFLIVRSVHLVDALFETPAHWVGSVTNSVIVDRATATLFCRSIAGTYDRNGLRLAWGRSCPHALYGTGCFVDKTLHDYARVIATVTGTRFTCVTHAEPTEGTFAGGFMEWDRGDGSFERRGIEYQVGNDFRVFGATTGLEVGQAVTLYPGCARTTEICKLFDNLPNYGGFPHLPGRSPFDGAPVF